MMIFFPNFSESFNNLLELLKDKFVAIIGHAKPDGDCIGSQVALCRVLNQMNIRACCYNADEIPRVLKEFVKDTPFAPRGEMPPEGAVIITVDCAGFDRVGEVFMDKIERVTACFDHHISNDGFAKYNFIDQTICATTFLLTGLFLDAQLRIDPVTAQALYIGILTDTGRFSYTSTDAQVFNFAKKLVQLGANPAEAATYIFNRESYNKLMLIQLFLGSLRLEYDKRICIGVVSTEDFEKTGALLEDTEGLVDIGRSIEGVQIAACIHQNHKGIKVSLRAKEDRLELDQVAEFFGGGGHKSAAGFFIKDILIEDFYPALVEKLKDHLNRIFKINQK